MRIFIMGAGATGGMLAQLLRQRHYRVWCGDMDADRARLFTRGQVECHPANARNVDSIVRAARGCHLLVNTVPAFFNSTVIQAALRLGVHYLDMASHLSRNPFKAEQFRYGDDFDRRGRLALINAGAAPGLTNLLVAACADTLGEVDHVRIRLFEETESDSPVSTWSAEAAHDEAISKPRIYRQGRFRFAKRFGEGEWFRFPRPIGESRVVLAAQDEAATLPRFIPMNDLDVKIGGKDMDRLRRWYRQGKLRPSDDRVKRRFPDTVTPAEIDELMRRGQLQNARFAICATVTGVKGHRHLERQRCCVFPSLANLRRQKIIATPIAYAAAQCAAVFVECFPTCLAGVLPPEALSSKVRQSILCAMSRRGFRFHKGTVILSTTLKKKEEHHVQV